MRRVPPQDAGRAQIDRCDPGGGKAVATEALDDAAIYWLGHQGRAQNPKRAVLPSLSLQIDEGSLAQLAERVVGLLGEKRALVPAENFLDVEGAAEFLACPKSRIYALVSARRLPHHRDGSRLLFDRTELRDFVLAGGARRP
jgi:excisionase family DNA binding protein